MGGIMSFNRELIMKVTEAVVSIFSPGNLLAITKPVKKKKKAELL